MTPRPQTVRIGIAWPPRRRRVTIAIGDMFKFRNICGALVSADTQIVATDLATKTGGKMHLSLSRGETYTKAFGIADAAEDGEAAKMLANEITSALCADTVQNMNQVVGILKSKMTEWYAAYGQNRPPSTQFVFAAAVGRLLRIVLLLPA